MSELDFCGKKILVMGLGVQSGGVEAIKFLWRLGARLTVTDIRAQRLLLGSMRLLRKYRGIRYHFGRHLKSDVRGADYILKNPGVPPHSPYIHYARRMGVPILTDIGIFFRLCPALIIGVTGTRGKSTASYLIWKFLQASTKIDGKIYPVRTPLTPARLAKAMAKRVGGNGRDSRWECNAPIGRSRSARSNGVYLAGNIGSSVLSILPKLTAQDIVVVELSSFQLHDLAAQKVSPHIAVITNIYQDHLNWHSNFKTYISAKQGIIRHQNAGDYAFVNLSDRNIKIMIRPVQSRVVTAKLPRKLSDIVGKNIGQHYNQTVALALAVGRHLGVSTGRMVEILRKFRGLPGRQEIIGPFRGIHFVNDTTATIPDATLAAIRRFSASRRNRARLILIAGGADKKLDFEPLAKEILRSVSVLILLPGDATEKLKKALNIKIKILKAPKLVIQEAKTMKAAVNAAWNLSKKGDWIVLSPGAASFGLFMNEFDRGKQFVNEIKCKK
ncbi:MAG: UDP-N-acetylmuramoyl-L-alanine--D-glutamate ligase [Candidatus Sungbacteria bacterium]|nr:UDP-N-acetylmuramoyl-L-alanine--D-glutamate ligase [Candidatus Sungbacteria bacterium]